MLLTVEVNVNDRSSISRSEVVFGAVIPMIESASGRKQIELSRTDTSWSGDFVDIRVWHEI